MTSLEELQSKVLHVINKNKQLQVTVDELVKENKNLKEQKEQLELSIMKENDSLLKEKDKVKTSIESLLDSISSLEESGL